MDSNHRRRKPADLQSAPVGHLGNLPFAGPSNIGSSRVPIRDRTVILSAHRRPRNNERELGRASDREKKQPASCLPKRAKGGQSPAFRSASNMSPPPLFWQESNRPAEFFDEILNLLPLLRSNWNGKEPIFIDQKPVGRMIAGLKFVVCTALILFTCILGLVLSSRGLGQAPSAPQTGSFQAAKRTNDSSGLSCQMLLPSLKPNSNGMIHAAFVLKNGGTEPIRVCALCNPLRSCGPGGIFDVSVMAGFFF